MPNSINHVCPRTVSKEDASAALGAGWARVAHTMGRGVFAQKMGIDVKTLARATTGPGLPELHTAFSSLLVDPTTLRELADLYGFEIRPKEAHAGNDFTTIAEMSRVVGLWIDAMADGVRDHRETLELAELLRPLIPHLSAVVGAADQIKGVTR